MISIYKSVIKNSALLDICFICSVLYITYIDLYESHKKEPQILNYQEDPQFFAHENFYLVESLLIRETSTITLRSYGSCPIWASSWEHAASASLFGLRSIAVIEGEDIAVYGAWETDSGTVEG